MSFKPGDFFLGVVNFLGVLVPGAIFLVLLLRHFSGYLPEKWSHWMVIAVAAYVLGQLLLAVSEILNKSVDWVTKRFFPALYKQLEEVEKDFRRWHRVMMHPEKASEKVGEELTDRGFFFHKALSYVRLQHAEAASEIDHHMADYKLLRCLVVVFFLDAVISAATAPGHYWQHIVEVGLAALSYLCFVRMNNWARWFAFDYALLIGKSKKGATGEQSVAG